MNNTKKIQCLISMLKERKAKLIKIDVKYIQYDGEYTGILNSININGRQFSTEYFDDDLTEFNDVAYKNIEGRTDLINYLISEFYVIYNDIISATAVDQLIITLNTLCNVGKDL